MSKNTEFAIVQGLGHPMLNHVVARRATKAEAVTHAQELALAHRNVDQPYRVWEVKYEAGPIILLNAPSVHEDEDTLPEHVHRDQR